jgi:CRP-like cAMP-binding protein
MFILLSGRCEVLIHNYEDNQMNKECHKGFIETSQYFGEISLLLNSLRTASVKAVKYSTLGKINLQSLHKITNTYPSFKKLIFN